jgi:hypothetical protein
MMAEQVVAKARFDKMVMRHAAQIGKAQAAGKMLLRILNDPNTTIAPGRELELASAEAMLASQLGATRRSNDR